MSPITFVTVGLTAGAALAAIPVIIHLVMRQTPKHVIFPALRLIKERQKRSKKRLRIRNWLLLLARMALVALMALALARPRLYSQTTLGDREVPTALGLVFDTSLSMEYKDRDKSRLQEAQERAKEILSRTHEGSQVFVVDSAEPGIPPSMSPAAAKKRIDSLALRVVNRKLNAAMGQAYKAVAASDLPRHEVYVFTDLARSAWDIGPGRMVEGLDAAKKVKDGGVSTYIVRLSPKELRDVSIAEAGPSEDVASADQPIRVKARLRAVGPAAKRRVEVWIDGVRRVNQQVAIPANGEVDLPPFETPKVAAGLHQGEVRLSGEPDPLGFDDRRYFTIDVQPTLNVLVVSDRPADAFFIAQALDPSVRVAGDPRPYQVTQLSTKKLAAQGLDYLKGFATVFLLNVAALPDSEWNRLERFVFEGGGLVVALGDKINAENYNDKFAAKLLPATIKTAMPKALANTHFGDGDWNHPLVSRNREELQKDLVRPPIYRHAIVEPRKESCRTILEFQDKAPALVERTFPGPKAGHVLLWTTALSRRPDFDPEKSPEYWNDFPNVWSFLYLMDRTVPYLTGQAGRSLTYEAGEDVSLPIDAGRRFTTFEVRGPDAKTSDRVAQPVSNATLEILAPAQIGAWTVTASGPEATSKTMGFSVNPPRGEGELALLDQPDLVGLYGKDGYRLADTPERLKEEQTITRVGREIFPWIMALILALVTAENFLANRFHRDRPAGSDAAAPASRRGGTASEAAVARAS